ncbi:Hypothetical predicted protein [Podarcis lilfordi]|uniref:Uncharacterized protein n=1 Tax=Podarcis lilfordi TaxID=74358 RepID=A0AA35P7W0_9SAUR|nr:Hypothetical predicted protein [Podarcis lilfordi]
METTKSANERRVADEEDGLCRTGEADRKNPKPARSSIPKGLEWIPLIASSVCSSLPVLCHYPLEEWITAAAPTFQDRHSSHQRLRSPFQRAKNSSISIAVFLKKIKNLSVWIFCCVCVVLERRGAAAKRM